VASVSTGFMWKMIIKIRAGSDEKILSM